MVLKEVALELDEEECEILKDYLKKIGDPDITIDVIVRAYIRTLNRAMPIALKSNFNVYHYFELVNSCFKHFDVMINKRMLSKTVENSCIFWQWMQWPFCLNTEKEIVDKETQESQYKH